MLRITGMVKGWIFREVMGPYCLVVLVQGG